MTSTPLDRTALAALWAQVQDTTPTHEEDTIHHGTINCAGYTGSFTSRQVDAFTRIRNRARRAHRRAA